MLKITLITVFVMVLTLACTITTAERTGTPSHTPSPSHTHSADYLENYDCDEVSYLIMSRILYRTNMPIGTGSASKEFRQADVRRPEESNWPRRSRLSCYFENIQWGDNRGDPWLSTDGILWIQVVGPAYEGGRTIEVAYGYSNGTISFCTPDHFCPEKPDRFKHWTPIE